MSDVLKRMGYLSEGELAELLGVSIKTLKNRPRAQLPPFAKAGHRRIFREADVLDFLQAKTLSPEDAR